MVKMSEHDGDELVIGAAAIAREVFGGSVKPRQVYRMAETDKDWPIFRVLNKLACRRGPIGPRSPVARPSRRHRCGGPPR
jgi:hypothetical protein